MVEDITLGQLAAAIGFLIVLFGGLAKLVAPIKKFNNRLDKVESDQRNDNLRLEKLEADTREILLSVNVLINHSIDNNHTLQLKERKAELDEYLIKR